MPPQNGTCEPNRRDSGLGGVQWIKTNGDFRIIQSNPFTRALIPDVPTLILPTISHASSDVTGVFKLSPTEINEIHRRENEITRVIVPIQDEEDCVAIGRIEIKRATLERFSMLRATSMLTSNEQRSFEDTLEMFEDIYAYLYDSDGIARDGLTERIERIAEYNEALRKAGIRIAEYDSGQLISQGRFVIEFNDPVLAANAQWTLARMYPDNESLIKNAA